MSLIPYSPRDQESQEVVLRHQSTLVLFDPKLRQLALRDVSPASRAIDTIPVCPYCHRSMSEGPEGPAEHPPGGAHTGPGADPGFVDRDYFRMLEASARASTSASGLRSQRAPASPSRRRLAPHHTREEYGDHRDDNPLEQPSPRRHSTGGISSAALSPGYFERFFVTERELGRGGKGVVLLVKHVLDGVPLGHFACKRVPVGDNHAWLEKVLAEVQLLQQLSHSNLVSYRHVWLESVQITNFGPSVPCAFILQQYCNAGDLHNYVLKSATAKNSKEELKERIRRRSRGQPELPRTVAPRKLAFDVIISFVRDIASGLSHLHANGFIHRDLKPQNCLLTDSSVPGHPPKVLVSDFGEVQMENAMRSSTGATGTISYCAPEVLQRVGPDGTYGNFTFKSDVFSLGMILYFMCFGNLPYECADSLNEENEDLDKLRAEISAWRGIVDKTRPRLDLPDRLYRSLERLLSPNPSQRPSADDILLGLTLGMGGNEDKMAMRPANQVDEESAGNPITFRRFSPVMDTPPSHSSRSNSPKPRGYATFNDSFKQNISTSTVPSRASKLRGLTMSSELGPPALSEPSSSSTSSPEPVVGSSSHSGSLDSSLILRPRIENQPALRLAELPLVLPPLTRRAKILAMFRSVKGTAVVKLFIFLVKVVSLTRPCSPVAPKPWIYYPLLSVATMDFIGSSVRYTLALLVFHMIILSLAGFSTALCMSW